MKNLFILFIAIATVSLFACKDKDSVTAPTADTLEGTYILKTVNGSSLPYTLQEQDGVKLQVSAGSVTITATGSATFSNTFDIVSNGAIVQTQTDTKQLIFKWDGTKWSNANDLGTVTASLSGGTLTVVDKTPGNPQLTFVYNR